MLKMNSIDTEIDILFNSLSNKKEFYKNFKLFQKRYKTDELEADDKKKKALSILRNLMDKIKDNNPDFFEYNNDIYYDLTNGISILSSNELF